MFVCVCYNVCMLRVELCVACLLAVLLTLVDAALLCCCCAPLPSVLLAIGRDHISIPADTYITEQPTVETTTHKQTHTSDAHFCVRACTKSQNFQQTSFTKKNNDGNHNGFRSSYKNFVGVVVVLLCWCIGAGLGNASSAKRNGQDVGRCLMLRRRRRRQLRRFTEAEVRYDVGG